MTTIDLTTLTDDQLQIRLKFLKLSVNCNYSISVSAERQRFEKLSADIQAVRSEIRRRNL